MLIEFSGLDCAGKSTQIGLLQDYLESKGYDVKVVWSRGGYTPGITWLKSLVRRDGNKKPEEQTEEERMAKVNREPKGGNLLLWLSIVDLILYWGFVFWKWSTANNVLLCDRYFGDTYIDFKIKYPNSHFDKWVVWKVLSKVYRKADRSFVLTVTPEESMRRSSLKFEPFPETEEKRKIRLGMYLGEIKRGRWQYEIDCMRPIDDIFNDIKAKVNEDNRDA